VRGKANDGVAYARCGLMFQVWFNALSVVV